MAILPVVLCGGHGSRLYPLSNPRLPKPFLHLDHATYTLFQQTLRRVQTHGWDAPLIMGNLRHKRLIEMQSRQVCRMNAQYIYETSACNTALSVAMAAEWAYRQKGDNALLCITPADHAIEKDIVWQQAVESVARQLPKEAIGLLGIQPGEARPDYGYLCTQGKPALNNSGLRPVSRFIEKPAPAEARALLRAGECWWNGGVFIARAKTLLSALYAHAPVCLLSARQSLQTALHSGNTSIADTTLSHELPALSFDKAVLNHYSELHCLPLQCGWHDLGSWQALAERHTPREAATSRQTTTPWGSQEILRSANGYQVKQLFLNPHAATSLQWHRHRSEHIVLVSGQARLLLDRTWHTLKPGEAHAIAALIPHRLENPYNETAIFIETQYGEIIDDTDIVRLEDRYGRTTKKSGA